MNRFLAILLSASSASAEPLTLGARTRLETEPKSGRFHTLSKTLTWDSTKTAVIVCDMWDKHWCPSAAARVNEMAPRVNDFLNAARQKGSLIIHCPSDCMAFYQDTPQRKRAMDAPKASPKVPLERWCKLDEAREGKLPIDDSNGGCDENLKSYKAHTRQHVAITIADGDAISDSEEVFHLHKHRGIENIIILGVHTNMCILGRSFGIRQMTKQGFNIVLVRDLTDSLYAETSAPVVSHFTGTDLMVNHIEAHWCPTILSGELLNGKEFRFKADTRPTIAIICSEPEYKTELTLPVFALNHLGKDFRILTIFGDAKDANTLPGLAQLNNADLMFLSVRRRLLPKEQLDVIRAYVASGKPIVAIRTSSHAFAAGKGQKLLAGSAEWPAFDEEILGCKYTGHAAHKLGTKIDVAAKADHEILKGFPAAGYQSNSGVYKSDPLAADCTLLLSGTSGTNINEPVAWLREKTNRRGRVFYASLGHADDFAHDGFCKLLANACRWAVR